MANTIKLKSGSGNNPSASDLVVGEVALRTDGNPKLFTKNDAGNVLQVNLVESGSITSTQILDGTIVNTDINANAAISGFKISPNFGGQNIQTTCQLQISGSLPTILLNDENNENDFEIRNENGNFKIRDIDNPQDRYVIASSGMIHTFSGAASFSSNLDVGAGINVTGQIVSESTTGTGSTGLKVTNSNESFVQYFEGGNANADYVMTYVGSGGTDLRFKHNGEVQLRYAGQEKLKTNSSGITITGNIVVSGDVDGVNVAATRTRLDTLLSSANGNLINGVTATTQSAGDNSTKVATTAYTDTAISNLVDSSPSTLNTLNELAAALGDDANFSTTVTNSIATKLPLAGGTLTGDTAITKSGNPTFSITSTTQGGVPKIQLRDGYNRDNFISIDDNGDNLIIAVDEGNNGHASTLRHRIDGVEVGRITRDQSTSTITHALVGNVTTTGNLTVNGTGTTQIKGKTVIGNSLSRPSALDSDADAHCRIGGSDVYLYVASLGAGGGYKVAMQAARAADFASFALNLQSNGGALQRGGNQVWDAGLDGAGSGLDADTLDGVQGSSFLRSDADDTTSGRLTLTNNNQYPLFINGSDNGKIVLQGSNAPYIRFKEGTTDKAYIQWNNDGYLELSNDEAGESLKLGNGSNGLKWSVGGNDYTIWNATNMGSGGGLDADTVDGLQASSFLRSNVTTTFNANGNDFNFESDGSRTLMGFKYNGSLKWQLKQQSTGEDLHFDRVAGSGVFLVDGNRVLTTADEGSGNGIDADTLDGQHGSYYTNAANLTGTLPAIDGSNLTGLTVNNANTLDNLDSTQFLRSDAADSFNNTLTWSGTAGNMPVDFATNDGYPSMRVIRNNASNSKNDGLYIGYSNSNNGVTRIYGGGATTGELSVHGASDVRINGSTVWNSGNDGAGSGLDADTLDGYQAVDLPFLRSDTTDAQTSGSMTFGRSSLDPDSFGASSGGFGGIIDGGGWGATGVFVHGGGTGDAAAMAHNGNKLYFGIQNGSSANSMATWLDVTPSTRVINFQTANNATNVQIGGNKIFHAGNDGAGSGLDADTLDGISSGSFLRSDVNDAQAPQRIEFKANATYNYDTIATSSGNQGAFEVFNEGSGNDAFMAFHTGSDFAFYFGLDADTNKLAVGGWSLGANKYAIYHEGNNPTFSQLGITAANINALGINATTLDSIDSSSFLRLDADNNVTSYQNKTTWPSSSTIVTSSGHQASLEVFQGTAQADAFMAFHVAGDFAAYFGLDGGFNDFAVGGWSMGNVSNRVWHAGNDGSGSGLDADNLDGRTWSESASNSTIVSRNAAGYIFANYFNTTADDTGTGSDCKFYASQDDYIRFIDLRSMRSVMNVSARSSAFSGREDQTSDQNYWIGSQGWGNQNFDTTIWDFGSCFFDTWSNPSGQPSGTSHWQGFQAMHYTNGSARYGMRITMGAGQTSLAYIQGRWNTTTYGWHKLWNEANDGAGSGLDSDLLDGQHGSHYLNAGNINAGTLSNARLPINLGTRMALNTGSVTGTPASRNAFLALGDSDTGVAQNGDGQLELWANNQEIMNIDTNGTILYKRSRINQSSHNDLVLWLNATNTNYVGDGLKFHGSRSATSANNFCAFDSGHASSADREFTLRGDGNAYADGTWNNNGADYAEFFESSTGSAIPVGTTVVLENNKVRAATSSDAVENIIGVVRPKAAGQASMTIGNTAWNKWHGKYLTDDFDCFILDDHNVIEWTDADGELHSYESHAIPSDVTVPSDAKISTHDSKGNKYTHYRMNPDFDSSKAYVPRHDRDEWVIIGLVGQVKTLKGQIVNDRWIKMRDVSDTVEEYFIR